MSKMPPQRVQALLEIGENQECFGHGVPRGGASSTTGLTPEVETPDSYLLADTGPELRPSLAIAAPTTVRSTQSQANESPTVV